MPGNALMAVRICTGAIGLSIVGSGWFYTFHSRAAASLAGIEQDSLNRRRVRLRRFGGCAMMGLGTCFFAGFNAVDVDRHPGVFEGIWIAVCVLLLLLVMLAIADLRLTLRVNRQARLKRL
jgi:peptidoglycan/LPS O-acetylase OafA/YrhL